jgi:DHA3 family tetracycline resistance protein-like MFS transporter
LKPKFLEPLQIRDFAVYWTGMTVSLLGDGIFFVAIAWQVYELWNLPTALALVGAIDAGAMVLLVAFAGVVADRFERRWVLLWSCVLRGASVAAIGTLGLAGVLRLWHLFVISAAYGAGQAFYGPTQGAIVPDLVPDELLVQANSLSQFVRPLAFRLVGPALGGWIVHAVGAPTAFLCDASSFAFAAAMLLFLRPRPPALAREDRAHSVLADIKIGWLFVRSHVWLWGTLAWATLTLFLAYAPWQVLVPYLVKNELHGSAGDLGLVFAAGGLGSVITAYLIGQRGLPRRHITAMYLTWAMGAFDLALYTVARVPWHAMVIAVYAEACWTVGLLVWVTLLQRLVPPELRGRVKSLDWLLSTGLAPISFVLCGPAAAWLGVDTVLQICGLGSVALTVGFYLLPGMRETEQDGSESRVVLGSPEPT